MKKRILVMGMAVLLTLSLSFVTGCSQDDDDGEGVDHTSLVDAVYGGETMAPSWMTITFLTNGKVICSFTGGDSNTSSTEHWEYSYYKSSGEGQLVNPSGGSTPGAFEISSDGKIMSFVNLFNNHGPKDIKRLRAPDKTIDVDPYTIASGSANLIGTIYGGENPGGAWVTFAFKSGNEVAVAFASGTGSTNNWKFYYTASGSSYGGHEGQLQHPDTGSSGLGPFSNGGGNPYFDIEDSDDITLKFNSFMGSARSFKRYR
jgi:hypothetical protein